MNSLNKILLSILIFLSLIALKGYLATGKIDASSQKKTLDQIEVKKVNPKAEVLSAYLSKHNSPMTDSAQDFIDAAKTYDLDWRLLPSIAGVESTFGKNTPGGYNAYGWGVYGTNRIYFKSWRDGMFTVAKGLRENYLNRGLTNPHSINIVYAASPNWGGKVSYFMNDLEQFSKNFQSKEVDDLKGEAETAAGSGKLAYKR